MAAWEPLFHQVFLMVLFCLEKFWCRDNLGDNLSPFPLSRSLKPVHWFECWLLLLFGMEEYGRPVLRTVIRTLLVWGCRVVAWPKNIKQLFKGYKLWVKLDLHSFDMASFVSADILVGRIFKVSSSIANICWKHSCQLSKGFLDAPKAACGKGCKLGFWLWRNCRFSCQSITLFRCICPQCICRHNQSIWHKPNQAAQFWPILCCSSLNKWIRCSQNRMSRFDLNQSLPYLPQADCQVKHYETLVHWCLFDCLKCRS